MRRTVRPCRRAASSLSIVLTVMFCLSIFLLVLPHCRSHPGHARNVEQMAQFNAISAAIELVNNEFDGYPPSDANDLIGMPYCGAMKLTEALLGSDLLGVHSKSVFRRDGRDALGAADLYPDVEKLIRAVHDENLRARKGPYLPIENANAFWLADIYGQGNTGPFPGDTFVLCDTFERERLSVNKTGMPILYYRANRLGRAHAAGDPNNIYNCDDNHALLALGVPGEPNQVHPLIDPKRFYLNTQNDQVASEPEPHKRDSFILISAGWDGLYGTADDVCNFKWKYRE